MQQQEVEDEGEEGLSAWDALTFAAVVAKSAASIRSWSRALRQQRRSLPLVQWNSSLGLPAILVLSPPPLLLLLLLPL